ncbi:MAG: hypothetical protein ACK56I_06660, partial [bacterium]
RDEPVRQRQGHAQLLAEAEAGVPAGRGAQRGAGPVEGPLGPHVRARPLDRVVHPGGLQRRREALRRGEVVEGPGHHPLVAGHQALELGRLEAGGPGPRQGRGRREALGGV